MMKNIRVRESIAKLETYHVENTDAEIVVNANESNLPLPQQVLQELEKQMQTFAFNRYPQIQAENLCVQLAKSFNLQAENVIIGNGSSELLRIVCQVFGGSDRKIMVPVPSFSMYGVYVQLSESEVYPYYLDDRGYIDKDALLKTAAEVKPDLLILCNPNNPTGNYNDLADIAAIVAAVDCPVVIDEAYIEFAGKNSAVSLLQEYDNIICLRTFSKAYGLAGMRCGYGLGPKELIKALKKAMLPYGVNAYTLMTAEAVYSYRELYAARISETVTMREELAECLRQLGFNVYPSATNFVTFYADGSMAAKISEKYKKIYGKDLQDDRMNSGKFIFEKLKEAGILVRDYSTNKNLRGCLRISIGLPQENQRIMDVMRKLCEDV